MSTVDLTSILQCPVSGSDLSFVDEECLKELRGQIDKGELRHVTGRPVQIEVETALSSTDGQFIYPVVDGILILLPSLAIVRTEHTKIVASQQLALETDSVMRFYDEIGWQSVKKSGFEDAERFEDLRPVSSEYIHRCHLRINEHIPRRGKYLLDVASGPLQYPEYLTYSEGYDRRICVDISVVALRAAKQKLGDKGIYIQGDITQLPLKNVSVDSFVSLHTIYHVPEEKQAAAFRELERVLKPEGTGVVVYSWGSHCLTMKLLTTLPRPVYVSKQLLRRVLPTFLVDWLKKVSGARTSAATADHSSAVSTTNKELQLYFHPHNFSWFQREITSRSDWDIRVWRSVSVLFLQQYVHTRLLGAPLLSILFRIENAFPRLSGRFGQFPMMVYRKAKFTA